MRPLSFSSYLSSKLFREQAPAASTYKLFDKQDATRAFNHQQSFQGKKRTRPYPNFPAGKPPAPPRQPGGTKQTLTSGVCLPRDWRLEPCPQAQASCFASAAQPGRGALAKPGPARNCCHNDFKMYCNKRFPSEVQEHYHSGPQVEALKFCILVNASL